MKLIIYSPTHKDALESMLLKFSKEVFGEAMVDIDLFITSHSYIYLAIIQDEVVGFTSFVINNYFGLRPHTVGNTYLYVEPEHRRSKSLHLMSIQAGLVARDLNMPLEHYVGSNESKLLTKRLNGKELYTTYLYEVDECMRVVESLQKRVKVK